MVINHILCFMLNIHCIVEESKLYFQGKRFLIQRDVRLIEFIFKFLCDLI